MQSSPLADGQPRLVPLALQSKKALQHGEALCSRASMLSSTTSQTAMDVLALDAKVRWFTDAVLEQLKMAACVAKSIEQKRSQLEKQAEEWDSLRSQRADSLDSILESLGSQVVPPDFHSTSSADVSPFGSQHDSDEEHIDNALFGEQGPGQSPTDTLRDIRQNARPLPNGKTKDRTSWKTLRDFVDERAVEDVLDTIESDRNALEDIFARTSDYPESLSKTIAAIENTLPARISLPSIEDICKVQEAVSTRMADLLESLAAHYDQMSAALREHEAGEEFGKDDLQQMNRDTNELPAIIAELEECVTAIEAPHGQLLVSKRKAQEHLETHRQMLTDLDELGEIMSEMFERQQVVENESTEHLALLQHHLITIEDLYHRFTSYQYSYNKLLLELVRRRKYRDTAEHIVKRMVAELDAMVDEERQLREEFNAEHGQHLPEDVCLYVQDAPTRWNIIPSNGNRAEVLPDLDSDLLEEARSKIGGAESAVIGSQSF
ncbi:uncharacterized protein LAESUDRAFT_724631 [Laetiporus sulphureus 93-53]|uniref:Autophagy-related protein 17 n=1 Tax=Laetiporus sulphureus 93-53 TaxID=1314785 RepID=A0A165ES47_9APHY|nr:uncharacterized protein LAESUDRAFT_724631 [Laetiporus sulphureus 93-53]KZT07651.1 hypothetical protein LAESUDRAFT_724631 [Laetiporus sulphureus 93-53]